MSDWFAMGGHGPFVWGSYAVAAVVLVIELVALRARRRAAVALASPVGDRP